MHVHLGGCVLDPVHVHADAAGVAAHQRHNVFTQPRVGAVQANQCGFAHGQVQQNFLCGNLNLVAEGFKPVRQQGGTPGGQREPNIG